MTETVSNVLSYFKTYASFMNARQVGTLVRKSASLLKKPSDRAGIILKAYEDAGMDLAEFGRVRRITERRANKPLIKLPSFMYLSWFRKLLANNPNMKNKTEEKHNEIMQQATKL